MYLVKVTFWDALAHKGEKQYVINEWDSLKAIKKLSKKIKKDYECDTYQIDMMERLGDTELIM